MATNDMTCGEILKVTQGPEGVEIQVHDISLPPSFSSNRTSMVYLVSKGAQRGGGGGEVRGGDW